MTSDPTLQSLKILLVDDQQEARLMLRTMLSELGVTQIFEAVDGRQAMSFLDDAADLVNLVICDWNMPKMSGLELLRQLRGAGFDIPFLMVTGRTDMRSVLEARNTGVTGYISKPFSPAHLEVKLRVLRQRYNLTDEDQDKTPQDKNQQDKTA